MIGFIMGLLASAVVWSVATMFLFALEHCDWLRSMGLSARLRIGDLL